MITVMVMWKCTLSVVFALTEPISAMVLKGRVLHIDTATPGMMIVINVYTTESILLESYMVTEYF